MNSRERYKKDNELIKPDEEYLKKLVEQMKAEERKQTSRRGKIRMSAAAAAVIVIFSGLLGYRLLFPLDKPSLDETIPNLAGVASSGAANSFSAYEDKERYERLISYMEADIASLEKSRTEDFSEAEPVSQKEARELLDKIKGMTYRSRTEELGRELVFYRIHSKENKHVIFTIEAGCILRLLEGDGELYT